MTNAYDQQQAPDARTVARIQKLLALARDGGATEGEANSAMEIAQRLMREANLDLASLEVQGLTSNDTGSIRAKETSQVRGMYKYQRNLMTALAHVNFCKVFLTERRVICEDKRTRLRKGYDLIGRRANIAAVTTTFDYLCSTISRSALEYVGGDRSQQRSRAAMSFSEGMADRLILRLRQRHDQALDEQARAAKEAQARARHPASANQNALVVVLEDYARNEADLNEDMRQGLPPGTTRARREEWQRKDAEARARHAAILAELLRDGVPEKIGEWMALGYSRERAEEMAAPEPPAKPETEAERTRREAREDRDRERWRARQQREAARRDHRAYAAGDERGAAVGLDKQISKSEGNRRLS